MFADIKIPRAIFSSEEHQMLKQTARDFFEKEVLPYHEQWEEDGMVSREVWRKAGEMGLLCLDVPTAYGGMGLDFSFGALVVEELARTGCTGPGFFLHSDIVSPYLMKYGSEEQKQQWLPRMVTGEVITAIGMTEPGCGSDLQALRTTATDEGDHYLVNGQKTFITNGYMSDLTIVAVRTHPGTEREGITLLLLESDMEGYTKGKPFKKVGMKAQDTCELFFDNVRVPKANLLGKEGMGFKYMMRELARERLIVGIMAVGGAEGALEDTIEYTLERKAFKQPIAGFQNTQFKLAEMATQLQIHQTFTDRCVELYVQGALTAEVASMAKMSCTDMHFQLSDECMQLHGGYGYIWEYKIARAWADNRVARIYAGTNEIMKLLISRGLLKSYFDELKKQRRNKTLKTVETTS
ncbi:MAG: acyl-CoA dehydrogenase family protein [Bacteroidota bacterium]